MMTIRAVDFTVLTVSIGYNHFLETWAKCVNELNVKPNYVIIGVDVIDQNLKTKIDSYIPGIKWVFLEKIETKHHSHYYNKLINLVTTTWVCKIDADDQILPSAYDELSSISADIYAFGNISSETGRQSIPDLDLNPEKILFSDNNLLSSLSPFRTIGVFGLMLLKIILVLLPVPGLTISMSNTHRKQQEKVMKNMKDPHYSCTKPKLRKSI
jgi:hypothetical protein